MKTFEARLEILEAARAKRRFARLTKMQRDFAVQEALGFINADNREQMLEAALKACRANVSADRAIGSREQREAAVRAAFSSVLCEA